MTPHVKGTALDRKAIYSIDLALTIYEGECSTFCNLMPHALKKYSVKMT